MRQYFLPNKVLLAALTIASISKRVMSPCHNDILEARFKLTEGSSFLDFDK